MKTIKLGYEGDETALLQQVLVLDGYPVAKKLDIHTRNKRGRRPFSKKVSFGC